MANDVLERDDAVEIRTTTGQLKVHLQPWPEACWRDRALISLRGTALGGGTIATPVCLQTTHDNLREFCEAVLHQIERLL